MGYRDIYELQEITGTKAKCDFIRQRSEDHWFRRFLYYSMNPFLTYNISDKSLDKLKSFEPEEGQRLIFFNSIFECCEYLSRLRGIDEATLRQVGLLLHTKYAEEERELYYKLLTKKVRLGIASKTINKIIPELLPEWEVQQSYPIEKYPLKEGTEFWLTQKLNGVRATLYGGQLIARSGMQYKGLDHIIDGLAWLETAGLVADGELTLLNKEKMSDNEAFRAATGIINSENSDKTAICFTIFDLIPKKDFESSNPQIEYRYRREFLNELAARIGDSNGYARVLPVLYHGKDQSQIEFFLNKMVEEDKEGLIVNTNFPYRRTRHRGILKVKRFYTMDLRVIGVEEGTGRLEGKLGALVLDYKGNEVRVGSGFTDQERDDFWACREDLIGSICEVKFKEISKDKKTGQESLQFPVFVCKRDDKVETNYE